MNEKANEFATWPATRLAAAIHDRQLSSREVLAGYLDRIACGDGPVNSVVALDEDRAMAAAKTADEDAARGRVHGPLHGVPCTIKDGIEVAGIRSTSGAPELAEHVPTADALAVARLRAAGAIVFGKTNVPIWCADMQTYNELYGTTSNPWALDRSPGGSSGGAAAAVACGFTGFELGTDLGGSVRIPAHLCGVLGLRPSYGVIPQNGYLPGISKSRAGLDVNVFGPIARATSDLDLLLDVVAGPDARAGAGWRLELPRASGRTLADYRIGLWLDDSFCPVETEYLALIRGLVDRLAVWGARLDERHPPVDFAESFHTYWTLMMAANGLNAPTDAQPDRGVSHPDWLAADDRRCRQRDIWQRWFADEVDVLLCPVLATVAYPHNHSGDFSTRFVPVNGRQRSHDDIARWTGLVGALGLPVATVPIGHTTAGLPAGVQVIAAHLHDRDAVRVAELIAEVSGGYRLPPGC